MAENGISRRKHALAPLYNPNNPSSRTTDKARTFSPPNLSKNKFGFTHFWPRTFHFRSTTYLQFLLQLADESLRFLKDS